MEHHRAPPVMSNGGHVGPQSHHPMSHPSAQSQSAGGQQQPGGGVGGDYDDLQARLGYMSMSEPMNGLNGGGDYAIHHHPHHPAMQRQPQPNPINNNIHSNNVIYYSNLAASQTLGSGPPGSGMSYQQAQQHSTHLQQQHQHQQQQQAAANRSLNPRAAVFVPRGFAPSVPMSYRPTNNGNNGPMSHYQNGNSTRPMHPSMTNQQPQPAQPSQSQNGNGSAQYDLDNEIEDYLALSYLKEFIYVISNKPALLNINGLQEITNIVNSYLEEDDCVLELVVNQLVDQSIVDVNFRFSGVKICLHFMEHIREVSAGTFKNLLIKRLQRECSRKVSPNTANTVAHMIGLAFFTGDLFSQSKSEAVGEALPNLLMNLTGSPAKFLDENCKCVCQVLKLCGGELDELCRTKQITEFDNIIAKLSDILARDETQPNVKELIKLILKSREDNWISQQAPRWSSGPTGDSTAVGGQASAASKDPSASQGSQGSLPSNHASSYYGDYVEADDFEGGSIYYPHSQGMMGYDFGNGDEDNQEICEDFENFLMNLPPQAQH